MVLIRPNSLHANPENRDGLQAKCKVAETKNPDINDVSSGSSHSEGVLKMFNEFRESKFFTDVVISVKDREFPCHVVVLCSCSPYFKAMFSNDVRERRLMRVELQGVSPIAVEGVLEFFYTGRVDITTGNVQHLLEIANHLAADTLRDACAKFLADELDPCNCLGFQKFCERYQMKQFASHCKSYALANFAEVCLHEEFLEIGIKDLQEYISSDDLCASKEEKVFEAVMRWVYHKPEKRQSCLRPLLQYVRLPLLHPSYFVQKVEADNLIKGAADCYQLLHEARRYHVLGNEMMSPRTLPRRSTGYVEVIVVVGGCERLGGFNVPYTECFDPIKGEWRPMPKLPEFTKSEYATCALRNDIVVSGGRINSRDAWMFNSQLSLWIRLASLIKGRWKHKMCLLLGKAYAIGGYDGHSYLKSVECYDSFSNRWSEVIPMKVAVCSPAVVSCAGKLYVLGGELENKEITNRVQCYDPEENLWSLRSNLPTALTKLGISAVSLNGLIYACGGHTQAIYCYSPSKYPSTDIWKLEVQTFEKKASCGISVCNGNLYILGGHGEDGSPSDKITCYDPRTGHLSKVGTMPRPISHHGCLTIHRLMKDSANKPMF